MVLVVSLLIFVFIFTRFIFMCHFKKKKKHLQCAKTAIVIGSGGHTLEMINLIKTLNPKLYSPRLYIVANNDVSSEYKIKELEREFTQTFSESKYCIVKIPRSRCVNQSYLTSIFTTLYSTIKSVPVVFKFKPDLVLCNGPGTCIPVCLIAFMFNVFLFFRINIVFIESICRVKSLSLSGKILMLVADVVIVQWAYLHEKYPQTVFLGRIL